MASSPVRETRAGLSLCLFYSRRSPDALGADGAQTAEKSRFY